MSSEDLNTEYEAICDELDSATEGTPEFDIVFARLKQLAERGSIDAAEAVAEIYCFSKRYHDAERAYRWYFRALSAQGYSNDFRNNSGTLPPYRGPEGDFRNEAPVNGLV